MDYKNDCQEYVSNQVRIGVVAAVLAVVAILLMGSADLGATSPVMRGVWDVHVDPTGCGGGRHRFRVDVGADSVHVTKPGATTGEGLRATANGNDLSFEVVYVNRAGFETIERVELVLSDGIMTGTSAYTMMDGLVTCSGVARVFATR